MTQKRAKKLVLLKTFYYRTTTQDGFDTANRTEFITNPSTKCSSSIRYLTDKNFVPLKNEFFENTKIIISANNPISGITKQIFQETSMIKTKCGFVSFNGFYFDNGSSTNPPHTTVSINNFTVTASSGDLKNAAQVTIEYDNDGSTSWSNGTKFARRVRVYGYK